MEKSTTFISLSGMSGVVAGVSALLGAGVAYNRLSQLSQDPLNLYESSGGNILVDVSNDTAVEFAIIALAVLFSALFFGFLLTSKKAKKNGQDIWGKTSRRLLINMAIPLVTGGLFCIALIHHGNLGLLAPTMLLFYGVALINGSKYTLRDIRALGFVEIALGLLSAFFIGKGLLFWAIGFGVMHIIYGLIMYFKYDK